MNCKTVIDKACEEQVLIYAHERTRLVEEIERLASEDAFTLLGYKDKQAIRLNLSDLYCFIVEDSKVYALSESEKLHLKCRLYQLEEKLPEHFVKINQSCIANINKIERFDASYSGALLVKFKNGYNDYVSRRRLKKVKERLGF